MSDVQPTVQEALSNVRATLIRLAADLDTKPPNENTARWLIAEARSLTNHLLAALEARTDG